MTTHKANLKGIQLAEKYNPIAAPVTIEYTARKLSDFRNGSKGKNDTITKTLARINKN